MYLGFIYAARLAQFENELADAFPQDWQTGLRPAPTITDRGNQFQLRLDLKQLDTILRATGRAIAPAVVFGVDRPPDELARLRRTLIDRYPAVEFVRVRSKTGLGLQLRQQMTYFSIGQAAQPQDLTASLQLFAERNPEVTVLGRAQRGARNASDFREPGLALLGMHLLKRMLIDVYDARRNGLIGTATRHRMVTDPRGAIRDILGAKVDISGESETTAPSRTWTCDDGIRRNFETHLKIDLGGGRGSANCCRIHYCRERGVGINQSRLYIGHCGEHLATTRT